jgi:hypothetical protein
VAASAQVGSSVETATADVCDSVGGTTNSASHKRCDEMGTMMHNTTLAEDLKMLSHAGSCQDKFTTIHITDGGRVCAEWRMPS